MVASEYRYGPSCTLTSLLVLVSPLLISVQQPISQGLRKCFVFEEAHFSSLLALPFDIMGLVFSSPAFLGEKLSKESSVFECVLNGVFLFCNLHGLSLTDSELNDMAHSHKYGETPCNAGSPLNAYVRGGTGVPLPFIVLSYLHCHVLKHGLMLAPSP